MVSRDDAELAVRTLLNYLEGKRGAKVRTVPRTRDRGVGRNFRRVQGRCLVHPHSHLQRRRIRRHRAPEQHRIPQHLRAPCNRFLATRTWPTFRSIGLWASVSWPGWLICMHVDCKIRSASPNPLLTISNTTCNPLEQPSFSKPTMDACVAGRDEAKRHDDHKRHAGCVLDKRSTFRSHATHPTSRALRCP